MIGDLHNPIGRLRHGVKILMDLAGVNVTDFDGKTLKMISPRFLSLLPEQSSEKLVNLLSPSIFSLHDQGDELEDLLSLPRIFESFGENDQDKWMDFIIEASGVADVVADMEENEKHQENEHNSLGVHLEHFRSSTGQPLYFTRKNVSEMFGNYEERKIDTFERLYDSVSDEQIDRMNSRGYAFLDRHQIDLLYGADSPYNDTELDFDVDRYGNATDDDRQALLVDDIRLLALADSFDRSRRRDIVNSPIVDSPIVGAAGSATLSNTYIVTSPLVNSPIVLAPATLGPIILSPFVFTPLVLSPRVLSPLILDPLVMSPLILNPVALSPFILTPGVMNPFVLSPFVLSPLILSPQVMTPLILSPFALSPLILTPGVMNPLVLSPFVLSPLILSPQVLFALVLSPYALSPLVASELVAASVVASPSILS